ncbi:MAG TPA: flavodoxin domain-containing protein [Kofleriaceae bacterium]|jgi:menaquinone-dependent protoporphyrinogen oxidase|nr:flavodoxin domain-containing protein [Kofleriaceae bacterium]
MRILVTSGSKHGGTEGIAERIAAALRDAHLDVELRRARESDSCAGFDAVIVGGALYANRWHRDARRFVTRHLAELQRMPVWLFSSGPLDDSATRAPIPPVTEVAVLMERAGALGHATFGGRLAPDVTGFPAHAMARSHSGDWRNPEHIRAWASEIAARLPSAHPAMPIRHPARSLLRLIAHAVAGWGARAAILAELLAVTSATVATTVHAFAAPLIFAAVAKHYFGARGARAALPVALAFTAIVAALDLAVIATVFQHSLAMFASFGRTWLPLVLIFLVTWATGALMATLPWPRRSPTMASTPSAAHR